MKYECKMIVKDRLWWSDNNFTVYIKYKPYGSKLYKPFGNKITIIENNEMNFHSIFKGYTGAKLIDYIEEFNNMTTKQIVDLVITHIKNTESSKIKVTDANTRFNNAITIAKKKATTFIVEV